MSLWKKLLIIFASILATLFLIIDLWYLYICFFAPKKINSYTNNFDLQVSKDENLEKNIIEIKYFSNKNKNGYEVFEIVFNSLKDEEKTTLVSKGYQFVAPSGQNLTFDWGADRNLVSSEQTGFWVWSKDIEKYSYSYFCNGEEFQYTTDNLSGTSFSSTNELNDETLYKVQIGSGESERIIGLQFKGKETPLTSDNLVAFQSGAYNLVLDKENYEVYHYVRYDFYYFSQLLFNSIQSLACGTNHTIAFDFADLFKYYECNIEDSSYMETLTDEETVKVINDINNYFGIRVFISEDGLQRSSDSLFGIFQGSSDFNLKPDLENVEYFTGLTLIDASLSDFRLVNEFDCVNLVLSDDFISRYAEYKDDILLNVTLDIDSILDIHNIKISKIDLCCFKLYENSNIKQTVDVGSNVGGIF